MGGPRVSGGSMPLPRISGFSEDFFYASKLTSDEEHVMSGILGNNRFQKGNRAARSYANLVVLFRMLLFYAPMKHHARFWEWVASDWGISTAGSQGIVSNVANFYSDARYAALGDSDQRLSLLVRLVDEWLMIRPRPELSCFEGVDGATVQSRRSAWMNIRDYHVDMLMDSKLAANLAGVEPPAKMVTSLWETDPEVAALLKEMKTSRKPKHVQNKVGTSKSSAPQAWPAGLEIERKRKVPLSKGEIDESEPARARNDSIYDERFFTPVLEKTQLALKRSLSADHSRRRSCPTAGHTLEKFYASAPPDSPDLIDLTSTTCHTAPPPQPVQQQPLPKPSPALIQSKLTHFASPHAAAAAAAPDRRQELSASLQRVASQTKRQQMELAARLEVETTDCVPLTGHSGPDMAAEERAQYDERLREMEARVGALERAHRDETAWGRSMGRFLYDANGRSVSMLQDVLTAIDTLQETSVVLLEDSKKREE